MAFNNTKEAVAVRHVLEEHTVLGEIIFSARYVVAVLAVVFNFGIAIAYLVQKCRRPTTVQMSPRGFLVLNLLIVDALVGAVILLLNLGTSSTMMALDSNWCGFRLGVSNLATLGSSHVALLNVVVDRFIAITYTLRYRNLMTWRVSVLMVCCGWIVPTAGALVVGIVASYEWTPAVVRCSDIIASRMFVRYIWIPTHFTANLCVIVLQWKVYLTLRRHDKEKAASNQVRNAADKSAWILMRITIPTYLVMLFLDVMRIIIIVHINQVILNVYQVTLLSVQIAFLTNPVVYSYATANIRKPISDLCDDIKKWLWSKETAAAELPKKALKAPFSVCVIGDIPFQKPALK